MYDLYVDDDCVVYRKPRPDEHCQCELVQVKWSVNGGGYLQTTVNVNGKPKTAIAHRVIAVALIPNPDNKPEIDHIDHVRTNNSLNNLRWVTHKENMANRYGNGAGPELKYREMQRAYSKQYMATVRERDREAYNKYIREYYAKNRERLLQQQRERRARRKQSSSGLH